MKLPTVEIHQKSMSMLLSSPIHLKTLMDVAIVYMLTRKLDYMQVIILLSLIAKGKSRIYILRTCS